MSKNILKKTKEAVYSFFYSFLGTSVWLGGCDTAYKYDITDGIDNNGAREPDITIDTEGDRCQYVRKGTYFSGIGRYSERRTD